MDGARIETVEAGAVAGPNLRYWAGFCALLFMIFMSGWKCF